MITIFKFFCAGSGWVWKPIFPFIEVRNVCTDLKVDLSWQFIFISSGFMVVFAVTSSCPLMLKSSFAMTLHGYSGLSVRKKGGGRFVFVVRVEFEFDVENDAEELWESSDEPVSDGVGDGGAER